MKHTWTNYITLGYRVVLLAGTAAVLYLQNHYVPRDVYEQDKAAIIKSVQYMQQLLSTMEERNKVNDRQDELLKDHELRLRKLEARHP